MRRFFIIMLFVLTPIFCFAEPIKGGVSFDWVEKSQLERNEIINEFRNIMFTPDLIHKYSKNDFKKELAPYLKDNNYKEHYVDVLNYNLENEKENLAGFYIANNRILYMYAIQYKDNLKKVYYYDGLGALKYVDFRSNNYPVFPYINYQYKINGKLSGAIYFVSRDIQYVYDDTGKFTGVWFEKTMFNKAGKKVLTRSNY